MIIIIATMLYSGGEGQQNNHKYFGFSQLILGYKQTFIVKTSW